MAWYVTQSLLVILATFALGLIVGWLWWGRLWRRVPLGESEAVRAVSERYKVVVAQRDARIATLAARAEEVTRSVTTPADADADPSAARGPAAEPPATQGPEPTRASGGPSEAAPVGTQPESDTDPGAPADTDADTGFAEIAAIMDGTPVPRPEPVEPDDLQRIEGIGPRIAAALDHAGLTSYRAVAEADDQQLSAALREAGLSFAPSLATWSRQAGLLADGDEEGLAALQAELTAGRSRRTPESAVTEPPVDEPAVTKPPVDEPAVTEPAPAAEPAATAQPAVTESAPTAEPAPAADVAEPDAAESGTDGSAAAAPDSPAPPATAEDSEEDELERVEGIGPRIATALRKAGIHTYRQLAVTDALTLQTALAASGLRFTPSLPTWSRQAALLAEGDEAGFLELTRTLVPDRDGGRPAS